MGIDKQSFVSALLDGHGYPAVGPYPESFSFGGGSVTAPDYDPEGACRLLESAGWTDTDGDGVREKDGQELALRWLTYPSRQELPLLAESAQAMLGKLGIRVEVNCTASHNTLRTDPGGWDLYASAMVTAPTGAPEYFFASCCLEDSPSNIGHYHSDRLEALADELAVTFDPDRRSQLAVEMQQVLLDDDAYVFCSHLQMSLIAREGVTGLIAHPCDYYEITVTWMWNNPRRAAEFSPMGGCFMAEMPLLQCDGLTVRYRDRAAVQDVSFSVLPGQAVAVVGESGSGKSTLLRAVMGLAGPGSRAEGSVRFAGRELAGLSPGALRQLRAPAWGWCSRTREHRSGPVRTIGSQMFECLAAHRRLSPPGGRRLALDLFARLDLPDGEALWHSLPGALSGGMLQRVGIAMALLPRPALLLADEPTSALDVLARRQVVAELARARQLAGTAILLVTHDLPWRRPWPTGWWCWTGAGWPNPARRSRCCAIPKAKSPAGCWLRCPGCTGAPIKGGGRMVPLLQAEHLTKVFPRRGRRHFGRGAGCELFPLPGGGAGHCGRLRQRQEHAGPAGHPADRPPPPGGFFWTGGTSPAPKAGRCGRSAGASRWCSSPPPTPSTRGRHCSPAWRNRCATRDFPAPGPRPAPWH